MAHQLRPAQHLAAQCTGGCIRQPHRGQVIRGQQLRQDLRIDLVGFDLRLSNRSRLGRIGHHHPPGPTGQHRRDRPRVAGHLQRHLIGRTQALRECTHSLWGSRKPPGLLDYPTLPNRHLRKVPVHIQPDTPAL